MVLLDLDGVLVDFVQGCFKHFDRTDIPYESVAWNLESRFFPDKPASHFWSTLGYDFWANLPWTPGGRYLLNQVVHIAGQENVLFCTSPCDTKGCAEGKIEWLKQNVPEMRKQYMITNQKHFAAKGNILIDDHVPNCEKFIRFGGSAILYPQPWNGSVADMDFVIDTLTKKLK